MFLSILGLEIWSIHSNPDFVLCDLKKDSHIRFLSNGATEVFHMLVHLLYTTHWADTVIPTVSPLWRGLSGFLLYLWHALIAVVEWLTWNEQVLTENDLFWEINIKPMWMLTFYTEDSLGRSSGSIRTQGVRLLFSGNQNHSAQQNLPLLSGSEVGPAISNPWTA